MQRLISVVLSALLGLFFYTGYGHAHGVIGKQIFPRDLWWSMTLSYPTKWISLKSTRGAQIKMEPKPVSALSFPSV